MSNRNKSKENQPGQQSAPVFLQGGQRYFIEALMQQGFGNDNLSVRWQLPTGVFEQPLSAASAAGTLTGVVTAFTTAAPLGGDGGIFGGGAFSETGSVTK